MNHHGMCNGIWLFHAHSLVCARYKNHSCPVALPVLFISRCFSRCSIIPLCFLFRVPPWDLQRDMIKILRIFEVVSILHDWKKITITITIINLEMYTTGNRVDGKCNRNDVISGQVETGYTTGFESCLQNYFLFTFLPNFQADFGSRPSSRDSSPRLLRIGSIILQRQSMSFHLSPNETRNQSWSCFHGSFSWPSKSKEIAITILEAIGLCLTIASIKIVKKASDTHHTIYSQVYASLMTSVIMTVLWNASNFCLHIVALIFPDAICTREFVWRMTYDIQSSIAIFVADLTWFVIAILR